MPDMIPSDNLSRDIIDHSTEGIVVYDLNLRCLAWNKSMEQMTRLPASYVVGRDMLEAFPFLQNRPEGVRNLKRLIAKGETATVPDQEILIPQNQHRFWISGIVAPHRDAAGNIIGMLAFYRDVTARKMANEAIQATENRFLSMLNTANEAICTVDPKNIINFANQRMAELTGHPIDEIIGKDAFSFVHPDDREMAIKQIQARYAGEKSSFDFRLVSKRKSTIWVRVSASPIIDDNNQYQGMLNMLTDISEARQAQEALKFTAAELGDLYNQAPCGYHSIDKNGVFVKINDTELAWLGYTRKEVVGKMRIADVLTPDSLAHFEKAFEYFINDDGSIRQIEYEVKRRDGSVFTALATTRAVLDDNKKFSHSHTSVYDITESKAAQLALEQNEARYRQMFENHPSIQLLVDPDDGVLVDANPAAAAFYGYSAKQLRGMPVTTINILPQEKILETLAKAKSGGQKQFELRHRLASGDIRDVQIHAAPLKINGRELIYSIVNDITEKKQAEIKLRDSELHYRDLVENADDIIYETDAMGHFIFLNDHTEKVLQYTSEEAVGKHFLVAIRPDWRDRVQSFYLNQFMNKIPTTYFEFPVVAKDGSVIWLGQNVRMVIENGRVIKNQAFCRDITERRKWEQEIEQSRAQLRELSKHLQTAREVERSKISREIHDELGAALTALKMDLSWQAGKLHTLDEKQITMFSELVVKVDSCIGTVRKIATDLRPSILDNLGLWAAIEWQAKELQNRMNIICEVKMSVQEIDIQQEEATAIFRILQETLTNVARHSKATKVTIQVDATENEVRMEISDNGKGMAEPELANIESLGLLGMYERAHTFGGEFAIRSKPGMGTIVSVQMPVGNGSILTQAEVH